MMDSKVLDFINKNKNMLVSWYLIASYAYYVMDNPIISDGLFDEICKRILKEWDSINHGHKYLLDKESLEAGTCLLSDSDYELEINMVPTGYYPKIVKGSYAALV